MNKILLALGLTLAASTGAFAQSSALDVSAAAAPAARTNDQITYNRAGNDGSPTFLAPQGVGADYTATASIGGVSGDQIIYDRADNDGSPRFR